MPHSDEKTSFRRVAGALRSCIDAHGPITLENVGSATKRVLGQLEESCVNSHHHEYVGGRCFICGRPEFVGSPDTTARATAGDRAPEAVTLGLNGKDVIGLYGMARDLSLCLRVLLEAEKARERQWPNSERAEVIGECEKALATFEARYPDPYKGIEVY